MKAVVYRGAFELAVEDVEDAKVEQPTDVVVRMTTTNICGSDLHMYEGRTDVEDGKVLGHENMGVVVEAGSAVGRVQVGDRVSLPFNIGCGSCRNCLRRKTAFCTRANPGQAGAAYGYASMGPYAGGQAELLRVPWADFNCLVLPEGTDKENHYAMLSDIFPTGWHGTRLAGLEPGETCVVLGAGPVGLMAAHSAVLQGASQVVVVDKEPDRLRLAESYGAQTVNYAEVDDEVEAVKDLLGDGADRGVECVGYQAQPEGEGEEPSRPLNTLFKAVRATGGIGVVGVYLPADPGGVDEDAQQGRLTLDYGLHFFKGQTMGTGQADVKTYNERLRDLITQGRATPGDIVSHELDLSEAPDAYRHFDNREKGWTKVLLKPAA